MINSRAISFLALFLGAFALFACATPIHGNALAAVGEKNVVARGGTCGSKGCNEEDLLDILLKVKLDIAVYLDVLDGKNDPKAACTSIAGIINAAVVLIADVDVNVSGLLGPLIGQIVATLVAILSGIIGCCAKYSLSGLLAELVVILDGVLALLVTSCCKCCPGLLTLLIEAVVGLTWGLLGFTKTSCACGLLGGLLCGLGL